MYQQQNGQQKFGDYVKYTPDKETFNMADTEPTTKETYAALAGYSSQKNHLQRSLLLGEYGTQMKKMIN